MFFKKVLNIKVMSKWVMAYWFEITLGIWFFLVEYLFFIKHKGNLNSLLLTNSSLDVLMFLIIIVLGIGLLSIGYINMKDERIKVRIREIRKSMFAGVEVVITIFVILNISVFLSFMVYIPFGHILNKLDKWLIGDGTVFFLLTLSFTTIILNLYNKIRNIIPKKRKIIPL